MSWSSKVHLGGQRYVMEVKGTSWRSKVCHGGQRYVFKVNNLHFIVCFKLKASNMFFSSKN